MPQVTIDMDAIDKAAFTKTKALKNRLQSEAETSIFSYQVLRNFNESQYFTQRFKQILTDTLIDSGIDPYEPYKEYVPIGNPFVCIFAQEQPQ